jgi:hypothetical protein
MLPFGRKASPSCIARAIVVNGQVALLADQNPATDRLSVRFPFLICSIGDIAIVGVSRVLGTTLPPTGSDPFSTKEPPATFAVYSLTLLLALLYGVDSMQDAISHKGTGIYQYLRIQMLPVDHNLCGILSVSLHHPKDLVGLGSKVPKHDGAAGKPGVIKPVNVEYNGVGV